MSIALHGNLRDFGIAEVFQLIGQQRKTGTLVIGEGGDAVYLAFDEGRVVTGGVVETGSAGGYAPGTNRGDACRPRFITRRASSSAGTAARTFRIGRGFCWARWGWTGTIGA